MLPTLAPDSRWTASIVVPVTPARRKQVSAAAKIACRRGVSVFGALTITATIAGHCGLD
jgi:hypothetical protein